MRRRNLFLPDELMDQVSELAKKRKVPMAEIIRVAIERYLAAVKKAEEASKTQMELKANG
jgi:predicted transcriptional regulator